MESNVSKMDIYGVEEGEFEHSLRYIHITAAHVVGIFNRIASLMRRKRYNMEEVAVSFDDAEKAHIIIAVDGRLLDVQHIMEQLRKLHDVYEVEDITHEYDRLFMAFFVQIDSEDELEKFPEKASRTVKMNGHYKSVFLMPMAEVPSFLRFLEEGDYHYRRRIMPLI